MSRAITLAGFAVIAAGLAACQIAALVWHRMPTIGEVASAVAGRRAGRWFLLAGWLWLGWHLFVRSHVGP